VTKAVRGPRGFEQFLAVDPDLSQAIRHMSDLPVATVVKAAKALLAEVKAAQGSRARGRRRGGRPGATVEDAAVTPEL
jgi:hypothetical protein